MPHYYRCDDCAVTYSSPIVITRWPGRCPQCHQQTLNPRLPILVFEQGDTVAPLFQAPLVLAPLVIAPLVIPAPTDPARFSVENDSGGFYGTAANKLQRPGAVLLGSFPCRNDSVRTIFRCLRLTRPDNPSAGVRKLAIRADPDTLAHLFLRAMSDQTDTDFTSLPYRLDPGAAGYDRNGAFSNAYDRRFREYLPGQGYELYRAPTSDRRLVFQVRARGLAGWPLDVRSLPPAPPTAPYNAGLPGDVRSRNRIEATRGELEMWVTLDNEGGDNTLKARDVVLFTQAPVLFSSEIDRPERLFTVLMPDAGTENLHSKEDRKQTEDSEEEEEEEPLISWGNFGTILDLCALAAVAQVPITLLPGRETHEDVWAQDAVLLGYCTHLQRVVQVAVATNRRKQTRMNLENGIEANLEHYLPDDQTGLFREILNELDNTNSMDYGGNVIVSPPVAGSTLALDEGAAGPAVADHPAAPYGKILLGDGGKGPATRPTRDFRLWLHAQKAQPVLPLDTSWLHVKHVDEILGLCQAPRACGFTECGAKGWVFLFADPDLCLLLHNFSRQAKAFVGYKYNVSPGQYTLENTATPLDAGAHPWKRTLLAIKDRLKAGLGAEDTDFVPMPVLYSPGANDAKAVLPNLVNGISLGKVVILPRPYGPRVGPEAAQDILTGLPNLGITEEMVEAAKIGTLMEPMYWTRQGIDDEVFPMYFTDDEAVQKEKILASGDGVIGPWPEEVKRVPKGWNLWRLKLDTVDIYEAYVQVRLSALGLTVGFVDDLAWYHSQDGELHCGSKVRRKPPAIQEGRHWWKGQTWAALLAVAPPNP
jgi:hypothetical protein